MIRAVSRTAAGVRSVILALLAVACWRCVAVAGPRSRRHGAVEPAMALAASAAQERLVRLGRRPASPRPASTCPPVDVVRSPDSEDGASGGAAPTSSDGLVAPIIRALRRRVSGPRWRRAVLRTSCAHAWDREAVCRANGGPTFLRLTARPRWRQRATPSAGTSADAEHGAPRSCVVGPRSTVPLASPHARRTIARELKRRVRGAAGRATCTPHGPLLTRRRTASAGKRLGAGRTRRAQRPVRYSSRCITATSSQRLNLRPTWRSMPTSSKPHRACRARDGVAGGLDAGHHGVEARCARRSRRGARAAPCRCPAPPCVPGDVDRVLDGRASRRPAPCRATARRTRPRIRRRLGDDGREGAGAGGQPVPPGRRASEARGRTCWWPSAPRGCRSCGRPRRRPSRPSAAS